MVYMPHWPQLLGQPPLVSGTARIKELLARLGNPHHRLPPVIHVAGTNGKGSVIAFLQAILLAGGYRVHSYTSPHLLQLNERIRLNDEDVSDSKLNAALETCRIAADGMPLTFFEGTTAAAFSLFAEHPADVLLIETGMGGRLDPTNIIESPLATVITPVSLDHQEYLGSDIGSIAAEKAGIAKEGAPCIIAPQGQQAMEVLSVMAHKQGATLFRYGYEWNVAFQEDKAQGLKLVTDDEEIAFPYPNLVGMHQITNAATAIATLSQLKGFSVSEKALGKGVTETTWPARLQHIRTGLATLLPKEWQLWLDGGHNEAAAEILNEWLLQYQNRPIYLVFGTTRGKKMESFLSKFKENIEQIIAIQVKSEPDSYPVEDIVSVAESLDMNISAAESIEAALRGIMRNADTPGIILICGSLFLARDIAQEGKMLPLLEHS